jgi:hypothetical protein
MFGFFKSRETDKDAIHNEAKRLVMLVNESEPLKRIAVGHSMFNERYGSIEGFKHTSKSDKLSYIHYITEMVEKLVHRDPDTAVGFRLFGLWITALTAKDDDLRLKLEEVMNKLSHEGNLGGALTISSTRPFICRFASLPSA